MFYVQSVDQYADCNYDKTIIFRSENGNFARSRLEKSRSSDKIIQKDTTVSEVSTQ